MPERPPTAAMPRAGAPLFLALAAAGVVSVALFPRMLASRNVGVSRWGRRPGSARVTTPTPSTAAVAVVTPPVSASTVDVQAGEDTSASSRRPLWRRLLGVASTVLTVGVLTFWFFALRPISLGGTANYTVIHGNSMWPLYHDGDLIITHQQSAYHVGDVVAYHVPQGEVGAGDVVIHRIVGGSTAAGLNLLGDNNPHVDPWHPKMTNIVGSTWVQIGRAGRVLVLLHQPLALAIVATVPAMVMFYRRKPRTPKKPPVAQPAPAGV